MSRLSALVRRWAGTKRPGPVSHPPSLLSHHPSLQECQKRTQLGYEAARHALSERPEIRELEAQGKFTVDWSANLRTALEMIFAGERERIRSVLEIGAFEGRLTTFCASYFPNARVDTIDTFAGSDEHAPERAGTLEQTFDRNVARFGTRIRKFKGLSREVLPRLAAAGDRYDIAIIDGSHFHDDAYVDSVFVWTLLDPGGVLMWDDYIWARYVRDAANPRAAIDRFLDVHAGEFEPLFARNAVAIRKIDANIARTVKAKRF